MKRAILSRKPVPSIPCDSRVFLAALLVSGLIGPSHTAAAKGASVQRGSSSQGAKTSAKPQTNSAGGQPDIAALMQQAGDALERKDYQSALGPLQTVTSNLSPDGAETKEQAAVAWYYLGYAYHGLQQNQDSRRAYEKAVELNADLYQAQLNLGRLLLDMRDLAAALPHLQKAAALKPADARLHFDIGFALESSGQSAAAEPELRKALTLDPKMDSAAYSLGQAEFDQKRYAEAATDFKRALDINPKRVDAELGLATVSEALGKMADAEQQLEQCLMLQPENASVRFHLAQLYLRDNKTGPAIGHLEALEREHAQIPGLDAALGDAYALGGKFSESETYYRKALADVTPGPSTAELHRALGETLLKENKTADAVNEFQGALKIDPGNIDSAKGLATSLYLEKRWAEAAPLIERLLRAPSPSPGLYFILATCYDHLRDREHALDAYKEFLARSNGSNADQEWQARQRAKLLSRELGKSL